MKEQSAAGADVAAVVEKGKSAYVGPEIQGKTLGVVGLGAIGVLVANAAAALGMKIVGYDPFLSVRHALNLTPGVEIVDTLPELYAKADYITLHLPMNDATRGTINEAAFAAMKDGVRIVNLARGELVDTPAMKAALASGKCAAYVTDFPNSETAAIEGVVAIPHLGASTPESEDNCAMMAAREVKDYLDNGSIVNSVNLPNLTMAWAAKNRCASSPRGRRRRHRRGRPRRGGLRLQHPGGVWLHHPGHRRRRGRGRPGRHPRGAAGPGALQVRARPWKNL